MQKNGHAQMMPNIFVHIRINITYVYSLHLSKRLDIFVTGVVGRSMGSGHFSVQDIGELTRNAVSAFNENLKKL